MDKGNAVIVSGDDVMDKGAPASVAPGDVMYKGIPVSVSCGDDNMDVQSGMSMDKDISWNQYMFLKQ